MERRISGIGTNFIKQSGRALHAPTLYILNFMQDVLVKRCILYLAILIIFLYNMVNGDFYDRRINFKSAFYHC